MSKPYSHDALARKIRHVLTKGSAVPDATPVSHTRATPSTAGPVPARQFAGVRLLFVDDDDLVRGSTAELLRSFGLEVVEAGGDIEAMEAMRRQAIDILLTDVGLGTASGVELAIEASSRWPALKVMFVSGYDLVLTPAQRKALPHAVSLRKPYALGTLIESLQTVMAGQR